MGRQARLKIILNTLFFSFLRQDLSGDLNLRDSPILASQVMGLKVCHLSGNSLLYKVLLCS